MRQAVRQHTTDVLTTPLRAAWRSAGDRAEVPAGIEDELDDGKQEEGKKGYNEEVKASFFPKRQSVATLPSARSCSLFLSCFFSGLRLSLKE